MAYMYMRCHLVSMLVISQSTDLQSAGNGNALLETLQFISYLHPFVTYKSHTVMLLVPLASTRFRGFVQVVVPVVVPR